MTDSLQNVCCRAIQRDINILKDSLHKLPFKLFWNKIIFKSLFLTKKNDHINWNSTDISSSLYHLQILELQKWHNVTNNHLSTIGKQAFNLRMIRLDCPENIVDYDLICLSKNLIQLQNLSITINNDKISLNWLEHLKCDESLKELEINKLKNCSVSRIPAIEEFFNRQKALISFKLDTKIPENTLKRLLKAANRSLVILFFIFLSD